MIQIPPQLQRPELRFVKILAKDKRPFEQQWQSKNNYKYNSLPLMTWLSQNNSYGVIGGYGGLVILDFDSIQAYRKVALKLPQTFTVSSGGRELPHLYYFTDDATSWKITDKDKNTLVDIQGTGKQCVGPGVTHKSGKLYKVTSDVPIAFVSMVTVKDALKTLMPKAPLPTLKKIMDSRGSSVRFKEKSPLNRDSNDMVFKINTTVNISDALKWWGIESSGHNCNCPSGHSSESEQCFSFKDTDALFHCFHCDLKGRGVINLVMQVEKIGFIDALRFINKRMNKN